MIAVREVLDPEPDTGSTLTPMRVPVEPNALELERLLTRLSVLVELRSTVENRQHAEALLGTIEAEIDAVLASPTKHRDWRSRRFEVLRLLTDLDQVLYYQLPNA